MHEITVNLHMHTVYSDGHGTHQDLIDAAFKAGVDAIIVTDHNIWVQGLEQVHERDGQRLVVLIGEEVHHQARDPQKNHLLVFGAEREMASFASDPQELITQVRKSGGLCFLAHPVDPPAPKFNQDDLSWVSWDVRGYTGIELWNAMTEFKSHLSGYLPAIRYSLNFEQVAHGPFPDTLKLWDKLLATGQPVVAVGGSDAHALPGSLGPIKATLFPYEKHFRAVNTHLLLDQPLTGTLAKDKKAIYAALAAGHAFIGYDLPAPTHGFHFNAHAEDRTYTMGDRVDPDQSITLQIGLPRASECRLVHNGEVIRASQKRNALVHKVEAPGIYRVEAYLHYKGKRRGWIFSNPIYIL